MSAGVDRSDIIYADDYFKRLKSPFKVETRQDVLEANPYLAGVKTCSPSSIDAPKILDAKKQFIFAEDKNLIYRGAYGHAVAAVGMYNNTGLCLRLFGFQKVKDGEPLGRGRVSVNTDLFTTFTEDAAPIEGSDEYDV